MPLHTAIRETGGVAWPVPDPVLRRMFDRLFHWGVWPYPPGVLDSLKFPVSLSGQLSATIQSAQLAARSITDSL